MATARINSEAVRALIYETGLPIYILAGRAGVSASTLERWANGPPHQRTPRTDAVNRLAQALTKQLRRKVKPKDLLEPAAVAAPEPEAVPA